MFEEDDEKLGGHEVRATVWGWRCWRAGEGEEAVTTAGEEVVL